MKRLVAYYSRTGTTRRVGEAIAQALGADSDEIIDLKKRTGWIGFLRAAWDARGKKLTKIQVGRNPQDYDMVIIGTPIWWGNLTPAVRTYLSTYDLKGRKVAFFITSASQEWNRVILQMKELAPESELVATLGILRKVVEAGDYEEQISAFAEMLK